jgi:hypothetical protein
MGSLVGVGYNQEATRIPEAHPAEKTRALLAVDGSLAGVAHTQAVVHCRLVAAAAHTRAEASMGPVSAAVAVVVVALEVVSVGVQPVAADPAHREAAFRQTCS